MKIWTRNIVILLMALCFVGCKPKQPPQPAPKESPKPPVTREVEPPAPAEPTVVADQAAPSQEPAAEEPASEDGPPLKAMLLTGQSAEWHPWRVSSPVLKRYLEETGLFAVDVAKTPEKGGNMKTYRPNFAAYDVVVIDYEGDHWSESTRAAFVEYIKSGGGVVFYHAANNNFPDWKEFNEIAGLSGWGDRDERWGPMVRFRGGKFVLDTTPGEAGDHGPQHVFQMINRVRNHPITKGLPDKWMHAKDELYSKLRGPAKNLTILATAYADPEKGGTGEHEPLLFTIGYGKGRAFNTALGHANELPLASIECVGFITTFQRGAEWAATGDVTQPVPEDFPTATEVRMRKSYKPPSLDELLGKIATYEYGQSRKALSELTDLIIDVCDSPEELKRIEKRLAEFLQSDATLAAKQFICRKLSIIGTEASVPTLAEMLTKKETSDMARFALERIPGEAVDEALRKALLKTTGKTKVGIINSLGQRRDGKSVTALKNLIYDSDITTAVAAVSALGQIASTEAAQVLAGAKEKATGKLHLLVLDAYLRCAEQLVARGERHQALGIYKQLYVSSEPAPIRSAALRGMIMTSPPEEVVDIIVDVLKGNKTAMQSVAIGLVGEMPGIPELKTIVAELSNLPIAQQVQLLSALGERGDPVALPEVVNATKSTEEPVRTAALKALGQLGDASNVNLLAQAAATTDGAEQQAARESLYRLRGSNVDQTILGNISRADPKIKVELIRSIGQRNAAAGVETLLKTAKDPDRNVRVESLKTLRDIAGPKHVSALVDLLISAKSDTELREAERAVASASRKAVSESGDVLLEKLASVKDVKVRCSLLGVLGKIGDDSALGVLRAALKEKDVRVQTAAIRSLCDWPGAEPMADLLKIVQTSDDKKHRTLALRGYVRLIGLDSDRPTEETIKMYRQAMALALNASEKKMVLSGLARTESFAALEMASAYLEDEALQQEAAAAIVRIAYAIGESHPEQTRMLLRKVIEISKSDSLRELREWAQEMIGEIE